MDLGIGSKWVLCKRKSTRGRCSAHYSNLQFQRHRDRRNPCAHTLKALATRQALSASTNIWESPVGTTSMPEGCRPNVIYRKLTAPLSLTLAQSLSRFSYLDYLRFHPSFCTVQHPKIGSTIYIAVLLCSFLDDLFPTLWSPCSTPCCPQVKWCLTLTTASCMGP